MNQAFNIAGGGSITLNHLEGSLRALLARTNPAIAALEPVHGPARAGDVVHSQADLSRSGRLLGYHPQTTLETGLEEAMAWYRAHP